MRLGYFGGSFDPPHRAHLRAATLARQRFGLDRVLLAPTGHQPLKASGAHASFADRLRMVELLCADEPGLEATDLDAPRPGGEPNYTVDTLRRLRASLAADSPAFAAPALYAIVGADAFAGIRLWRDAPALFTLAQWIVLSRPGFPLDFGPLALSPAERAVVHLLPELHENLSATALRQQLGRGDRCTGDLPAPVFRYIRAHRLYGVPR